MKESTPPDARSKPYIVKIGDTTLLHVRKYRKPFNCLIEETYSFSFKNDKLFKVSINEINPPVFTKEKGVLDSFCGGVILSSFEKIVTRKYKQYNKRPIKDEEYRKIWVFPSTTIEIEFINVNNVYYLTTIYEKRQT